MTQLLDGKERMEINAAIEQLLDNPDNEEAAQTIIERYQYLSQQSRLVFESEITFGGGSKLTGHTRELGQVSISTNEPETKEVAYGIRKERVGYYKLWTKKPGLIAIQYWWKSEITTQGIDGQSPLYLLYFNPITKKYRDIGLVERQKWFSLWVFHFIRSRCYSLRDGKDTGYRAVGLTISNYS